MRKLVVIALLLFASSLAQAQFSKVVLTWTAAQGATGYNVYRCTDPTNAATCTKLNSSPISGTTYTDQSNLVNNTTYWYVATSLGNFPESNFSNVAAAYYGPPPTRQLMPAPSGVQAGPQ